MIKCVLNDIHLLIVASHLPLLHSCYKANWQLPVLLMLTKH